MDHHVVNGLIGLGVFVGLIVIGSIAIPPLRRRGSVAVKALQKPTCPRCKHTGYVANFCPSCGNQIVCMYDLHRWMEGQAETLRQRRSMERNG